MRLASEIGLTVLPLASNTQKGCAADRTLRSREGRNGLAPEGHGLGATLLELDEMMARYASYEQLATVIRQFTSPKETLKELFGRLLFNILCGNTDDHVRNHAAFWSGAELALTPA
jgi:serine/threonine-protein kinase HipA